MPATLRFLSGWLNGEMLVISTNSPDLTQFCKVLPRGRLVASPTGGWAIKGTLTAKMSLEKKHLTFYDGQV